MKMSTQTLATASARHPWRTLLAWIAVFAAAIVAIVALLGDGLTTDDAPTNNPESERAIAAQIESFPPDPERMQSSDIVVVRSEQHTVDSAEFESFVRSLVDENDVPGLTRPRTYLDGDSSLVSDDRHATIVPLGIPDEDAAEMVIAIVEQADEDAAFAVSVTGDQTLDYDFNLLSQEDLEKGELQFGLPAALIILLLVFGAVVAGLIPLLMAIVSIVIALGLTALLAQPFDLSIFIVNMLTGMGLALGIDYSLFVVSRYREERARGLEKLGRDRGVGRDGEPGGGLQRDSVRRRDVRDAPGAELDHAEPRRGGDSRRHRVGGRRDHALAGPPRVARRSRQRAEDPDHRAAHARVGGHRRALLGRDRAKRPATPRSEPRALDRAARRSRLADPRHQHRDERRLRAAGSLRLQAGLSRARERLRRGDDRPGGDRGLGRCLADRGLAGARRAALDARGRRSVRQRRHSPVRGRRGRGPLGPGRGRRVELGGGRSRSRAPLRARAKDVRRNGRGGARRRDDVREHRLLRVGDRSRRRS